MTDQPTSIPTMTPTDMVDVGIVIVVYNLIEECLSSLAEAIAHSRYSTKVVIIDNDSPKADVVQPWANKHLPHAQVVMRGFNHGFGRSMNFGAAMINAKYYFLLNPDTILTDPDILNKMVEYMQSHPDVGLIAPKISNFDGTRQDTCRRFPAWYQPLIQRSALCETRWGKAYLTHFQMHDFDQSDERKVDWVQGSAMFLPGNIWRALNGFDHRYWMYFEDIDLCRRIWGMGKAVVYLPSVQLQHLYGRASAKIKNPILNILKTKATRAHLASWAKYMWKWKWTQLPKRET